MLGECGDRVMQDGGAAERKVLLGHSAAEPTAPTGRYNEGVYGSHARIYRTIQGLAIAWRRIYPTRPDAKSPPIAIIMIIKSPNSHRRVPPDTACETESRPEEEQRSALSENCAGGWTTLRSGSGRTILRPLGRAGALQPEGEMLLQICCKRSDD
jgi:hypothetical protein